MILRASAAFYTDRTPVTLHELLRHKEADARTYSTASGNEGLEDLGQRFRCNSDTVVLDRQTRSLAGC
jgi:hypothetical protein